MHRRLRIYNVILFFFIQGLLGDAVAGTDDALDDTLNHLLRTGQKLVFVQPDSARLLVNKALVMSKLTDDKPASGHALYLLGNIHLVKGDYPEALNYYQQSLEIRQGLEDSAGISDLYSNIGIIYARMGDQGAYMKYLLKTLAIDRALQNRHMIAADFNNIGNVYFNSKESNEALVNYRKALLVAKEIADSSLLYATYGNIGNAYQLKQEYDSALFYSNQALAIARLTGNKNELGVGLSNHGLLYSKLEQYDSALLYYNAAIHVLNEINAQHRLAGVINDKARLFLNWGQPDEAITMVLQNPAIAGSENSLENEMERNEILALGYAALGDFQVALSHQKAFHQLSDSLMKSHNDAEVQKLMRRFEVNEKEREIGYLLQKNRLARERNILLTTLSVLIFLFLVILHLRNRKLNNAYHLLLDKQKQIARLQPAVCNNHKPEKVSQEQETVVNKMEAMLIEQKVYLDSSISLSAFADMLDTNTSKLSAFINSHYGKNFNALINEYRINEVLRCFGEKQQDKYTMEAIAEKVGFGNRVTFYSTFKKVTGVTPTFYLKNLKAKK